MPHDHHAKAVASGALPLPRLEPILSTAWQGAAGGMGSDPFRACASGRWLSAPTAFPPSGQPVSPSTLDTVKALTMGRYVRPDTSKTTARGKRRRPKNAGLVARSITYRSAQRPHDRPQELTVKVPQGEIVDAGYAAAVIAVRTNIPLTEVIIVTISAEPSRKTADR